MAKNSEFFEQSKAAQATLKHAILRGYLATFVAATGKSSPGHRVGYIDGYAGPGEYVNKITGTRSAGSPRIAIEEIEHQLALKEPRHLECVFIEKKQKYFDQLESMVELAESRGLPVSALHGDVTKLLAPSLERFNDSPLLVFLDPFGASLPHSASIPFVLGRASTQPTEVMLNFSVETLRRSGARIHEPVGAKGREANLKTMDNWLGGDWWRDYFTDRATVASIEAAYEPAEAITDEYARRVCEDTRCSVFPVDIRRAASHKPLFRLMLFHPKPLAAFRFNEAVSLGHDKWREAMWDMDVALAERDDERDPQPGTSQASIVRAARAADPSQIFADTVNDLKNNIRHGLRNRNALAMETDFHRIFGESAGIGRGKHLTKAWDELTTEGVTLPRKVSRYEWAKIWRNNTPTSPSFK